MATENVVELDFDLIKDDIKTYLRDQPEFKDYDFEGAGLNVLLDILAKNSHLNAYMANVMSNEMFLDSAEIRQSVVSKAKELGYTPRSVRASQAVIDLTLNTVQGSPAYVEVEPGTQFTNSNGIIFSTVESHLLEPTGTFGQYEKTDIPIYDGRYITFQYVIDSGTPDQRFIVPSVDADMSTLSVVIKESEASSETTVYSLNEDINYLTPESTVYFLHETAEGYFEITFGDNVLGKKPVNGNVVVLGYIVAGEKGDANGILAFEAYERINGQGGNDIDITTTVTSFNGSEKQTIDEIKFHAQRFFQSQRRAVTTTDYEAFIIRDYPFIESINTWGGEYNIPPVYGKIFIAIKPTHTEFLSDTLKELIKEDLIKEYNVVTVIPELVDPDYIYVIVDSDVYYTKSKTTKSEPILIEEVLTNIHNYFLSTTNQFRMKFQFSPMTRVIDDTDQSIDNSLTAITISKRVYPIAGQNQTFSMLFSNALKPNTIYSTYLNTENEEVSGESLKTGIMDDGNGILYAFNAITGNKVSNVGTVDYETGTVSFTIKTYSLPADTLDLRMYATPDIKNIMPGNNQIIIADTSAANGDFNRLQGLKARMVLTNTEVA